MAQRRILSCRSTPIPSVFGSFVVVSALLVGAALLVSGCDAGSGVGLFRSSELAAKSYRDDMKVLIVEDGLADSEPGSELRQQAHERTVDALAQVDRERREDVMRYLSENMLLQSVPGGDSAPIVSVRGADLHGSDGSGTDLSNLSLTGANLAEADLRNADLSGAVLEAADLRGAKLNEAALAAAWLFAANLSRAELEAADLRGAELVGANLSHTDLTDADLCGADLRGADLSRAQVSGTLLTGADLTGANLSGVQGLTERQLKATASYLGAEGLDALGVRPDTRSASAAQHAGSQ